jgi:hypothetical protein
MAEISSSSDSIAAVLVTTICRRSHELQNGSSIWNEPSRRRALWTELSADSDLNAIQIASGDHRAMAMDGD